ncbi:MAG: hypothetical protein SFX18_02830 [Pirellulales bacterium]|nr:hypothetical protein [Pirellulales bacterium]
MPIRTIETVVDIDEDRRVLVQLPLDVPVGRHRLIAVLDETTELAPSPPVTGTWSFPVLNEAKWSYDLPLSRGELYSDDGR